MAFTAPDFPFSSAFFEALAKAFKMTLNTNNIVKIKDPNAKDPV